MSFWLLKAEPDSHVVKGKDVKFSVDDFEAAKTSPWEGVRNYEARNLMKEMKLQDKALFYHSNCKNPGIAAFAEVSKEFYPDFTAWDSSHPYYDSKTDKADPKWFMVDLTFVSRARNFVPLTLLKYIAGLKDDDLPKELSYISTDDVNALKSMDLILRGRLSVQRVNEAAWNTIQLLAENGGWNELDFTPPKKSSTRQKAPPRQKSSRAKVKRSMKEADSEESAASGDDDDEYGTGMKRKGKARKEGHDEADFGTGKRRRK